MDYLNLASVIGCTLEEAQSDSLAQKCEDKITALKTQIQDNIQNSTPTDYKSLERVLKNQSKKKN